jgi:predicted RNA-binding Zn-ribbon protein involved in translation (DUF1610 family)
MKKDQSLHRVVFKCHKCGHILILEVGEDYTVEKLMNALGRISNKDCPNCGEEPYDNWALETVAFVP